MRGLRVRGCLLEVVFFFIIVRIICGVIRRVLGEVQDGDVGLVVWRCVGDLLCFVCFCCVFTVEFSCRHRLELLVLRALCVSFLRVVGGTFAPVEGVCVCGFGLGGRSCYVVC